MSKKHSFYAMTAKGVGFVLEKELKGLGFQNVLPYQGGVFFEGTWSDCYLANLKVRTSSRILLPVLEFYARSNEDLYKGALGHDYSQYIEADQTFAVDAVVNDSFFTDQRFVALKVKDAIADQFREKLGVRPDVDRKNPDMLVVVRISKDKVSISIDTSGVPLFKRGYRTESVEAPVKEHVAAGLLAISEWNPEQNLVDPMCGSGTLLIEGALKALNIAPGTLRKSFAFQKFKNFDKEAWGYVTDKVLSEEKETTENKFFGFDIDREAIEATRKNSKNAGVSDLFDLKRGTVSLASPPVETGMLICNPPYGERLITEEENLLDVYRDLGYALRTNFKGWAAWVLTPRADAPKVMGLKATTGFPIMNGKIPCQFIRFDLRKNI